MTFLYPYASVVLRGGLVVLSVWFGIQQITVPDMWVVWVPGWATALSGVAAAGIVLINGWFEVVLGLALLVGIATRPVALVLGFHLLIIALDIGVTPIGVRDFALSVAAIALACGAPDFWTVDHWLKRRKL